MSSRAVRNKLVSLTWKEFWPKKTFLMTYVKPLITRMKFAAAIQFDGLLDTAKLVLESCYGHCQCWSVEKIYGPHDKLFVSGDFYNYIVPIT